MQMTIKIQSNVIWGGSSQLVVVCPSSEGLIKKIQSERENYQRSKATKSFPGLLRIPDFN